ncbi:N-acetylmuramic acid 6-phosphate etherase [Candidatus Zixiibacteriota bacterium]
MSKELFDQLAALVTEAGNPKTAHLDRMSVAEILQVINEEDRSVPEIIAGQMPQIARAVELYIATLRAGNRIFYLGAGTSGRLGVLDAAECPPTFGADPDQIIGVIAGGRATLVRSREGIEDKTGAAQRDLKRHKFTPNDLLIAIAASGRTPYTLAGLAYARSLGARTIFICANPSNDLTSTAEVVIPVVLGPEVIAGSTRMKAGTAQKLILNMISTAAMVRLGKTYGNLMVDLRAASAKLAERSRRILMVTTGVDYRKAGKLLKKAGGEVKTALVMAKLGCTAAVARRKLKAEEGFVYRVVEDTD